MTRAALVIACCCSASCTGVIGDAAESAEEEDLFSDDETGTRRRDDAPPLPSAAMCNEQPVGRSYRGFEGRAREAKREPYAAGSDRDVPTRNNDRSDRHELERRFPETLGVQPWAELTAALRAPSAESTFGTPPALWYSRVNLGPMTAVKLASLGFLACDGAIRAQQPRTFWLDPMFAQAPTTETAPRACAWLMERAWRRVPDADELAACVDVAVNATADEPDPVRRWAYMCASVFAGVEFVTR